MRNLPETPAERSSRFPFVCVLWSVIVLLRATALESDAYPRLSWSSALLTDEGFYLHNARNLVLFGQARLDGFNNMLIMPLLHLAQVGWFHLLGVGLVQARLLSVVCSLLTLGFFTDGLRRAFGPRAAVWGLLLLGLDHVNLLYNRLALMDTPGALVLTAAWWAWVRGSWLGCGLLLGAGYGVRGLDALLWPVAIGVLWGQGKRREAGQVLLGIGLMVGLSLILWYLPNRVELAHANGFYLFHQFLPHSVGEVGRDLLRSLVAKDRGIFPYLLRHTPVQLALCLCLIASYLGVGRRAFGRKPDTDHVEIPSGAAAYLVAWLLVMVFVYATARYAPDRYYVLFYPAMAGLSALALAELPRRLTERGLSDRTARRLPAAALCLWAAINLAWTGDWLAHLTYTQRDAGRWLAQNLPAGSVLLGDASTGLCFDNRIFPVPVKPGLCNEDRPVERFAGRPRYLALSDARDVRDWWLLHYPALVSPGAVRHRFPRVVVGAVTLYAVPEARPPIITFLQPLPMREGDLGTLRDESRL